MSGALDLSGARDFGAVQALILARWPRAVFEMRLAPQDEPITAICADGDGGAAGAPEICERVEIVADRGQWFLASDETAGVLPVAWLPTAKQRRAILAPETRSLRGAAMGRLSDEMSGAVPAFATRLRVDAGGYDRGGAYWGCGAPLWGVIDADGARAYVRAPTAAAAVERACAWAPQ